MFYPLHFSIFLHFCNIYLILNELNTLYLNCNAKKVNLNKHSSTNERYYHEYLSHGSPEFHPDHEESLAAKVAQLELQHDEPDEIIRTPSAPQSPAHRTPSAPMSPVRVVPQHLTFADQKHSNGHSNGNGVSPLTPVHAAGFNKMHTGMKNISTNVGLAVSPSARMEFDQEANEGFGSVKIGRPIRNSMERHSESDSIISDGTRINDQGHVDLKFYHNRLW